MGIFDFGASQIAASQQRDFQERMFKTRYQMTMDDMSKAGLNPILAAKLGGGQAPPGAAAAPSNIDQGIQGALTGYIQRKIARTNSKTAEATLRIKEADALIAERDARIGTSPHGIDAYTAGLIPAGPIGASAYGVQRAMDLIKNYPDRPRKKDKRSYPPYRKNYGISRDIFGDY